MGWNSPITHPTPFYPTFEGHSYRQMGRVSMRAHLQFGSYKLMHLLGIHSSSIPKNCEWTIIILSRCTPSLFSYILMYTLNISKLYTIQHYKCIHNSINYKRNITSWPWTHLYQCNSNKSSLWAHAFYIQINYLPNMSHKDKLFHFRRKHTKVATLICHLKT